MCVHMLISKRKEEMKRERGVRIRRGEEERRRSVFICSSANVRVHEKVIQAGRVREYKR